MLAAGADAVAAAGEAVLPEPLLHAVTTSAAVSAAPARKVVRDRDIRVTGLLKPTHGHVDDGRRLPEVCERDVNAGSISARPASRRRPARCPTSAAPPRG